MSAENKGGQKIFRHGITQPTEVNTGFYYDSQINDPFLSISLHPNTKPGNDRDGNGWKAFSAAEGDVLLPRTYDRNRYAYSNNDTVKGGSIEEQWDCYSAIPIARAILTEDFSFSIGNDFTDINNGNPIEEIFNGFKSYAPILSRLSGALKGIDPYGDDMGSWVVGKLQGMLSTVGKFANEGSRLLNRGLIVQGTRFSSYNGSYVNFSNMELKFTAFSDWIEDGTFQPVTEYIQKIRPYVMGEYKPSAIDLFDKKYNDEGKETFGSQIGSALEMFLSEYIGYQNPPGGFRMSTMNLDYILKGTLRLEIGGLYSISNLVLKNMNVTFSKVQTKDPRPDHQGEIWPLYAEIVLQLVPASMFIDTSLDRLLGGVKDNLTKNKMKTLYAVNLNKLSQEKADKLNNLVDVSDSTKSI